MLTKNVNPNLLNFNLLSNAVPNAVRRDRENFSICYNSRLHVLTTLQSETGHFHNII